ncbi:MAG: outer membrane protein assembly factor BamA [Nitrospirota bacterium]
MLYYAEMKHVIIFFIPLFLYSSIAMAQKDAIKVKMIDVQGNRKIEKATIKSKIKTKVGDTFSVERIADDVKAIYEIGYFDDITVETEGFEGGIKLIFKVIEKPTITSVRLEGNKKIDTETLVGKITIKPGEVLNQSLIANNTDRIAALYQEEGYYHAKITPVVKSISREEVTLTYLIEEGPKVKIKDIIIEGNKAIKEKEIKKAMKTRKRWLFSWIDSSGIYKKDEMAADIERIKSVYYNKGYIQVAVEEPRITLSKDGREMYITIKIDEGEQFRVKEIKMQGNKVLTTQEIRKLIKIKEGKPFSRETMQGDISSLTDAYSEKGHALVDITPLITTDKETKTMNITLDIKEGSPVKVGRITISGNTTTRDKVIRREMRLDEGDLFNTKLMRRSYDRINNLNYFESVDMIPEAKPAEDVMDIHINVKERPTGSVSVGGGYSNIDRFIATAEVAQANVEGTGQKLRFRGEFGKRRKNYVLSFREPWLMDKPISAGTSLYKQERQFIDYKRKASGLELSLGKSFTEYVSSSITYNYEKAEIFDIAAGASSTIREQEGKKTTSSIGWDLVRDSRDNYIDPTRGSRNSIYIMYAGLGGDNYFYKTIGETGWYFPLPLDTTFLARGIVGYADGLRNKKLPLYERFYVGGLGTVRGFGWGEASAKDAAGEKIGGVKELIFNFEYIFPIVKAIKFKGVIFHDQGYGFGEGESMTKLSKLRRSAGAGIRWISPIGPIRLEWGRKLDRKAGESGSKIEFSFGTFF